jgi:hypothetical protein
MRMFGGTMEVTTRLDLKMINALSRTRKQGLKEYFPVKAIGGRAMLSLEPFEYSHRRMEL